MLHYTAVVTPDSLSRAIGRIPIIQLRSVLPDYNTFTFSFIIVALPKVLG